VLHPEHGPNLGVDVTLGVEAADLIADRASAARPPGGQAVPLRCQDDSRSGAAEPTRDFIQRRPLAAEPGELSDFRRRPRLGACLRQPLPACRDLDGLAGSAEALRDLPGVEPLPSQADQLGEVGGRPGTPAHGLSLVWASFGTDVRVTRTMSVHSGQDSAAGRGPGRGSGEGFGVGRGLAATGAVRFILMTP
jgi:hypothetical protein